MWASAWDELMKLKTEVMPNVERMDKMEPGYMRSLLQKAGEQGLLSVAFPEEYGGLGKDFVTSTIVSEYLGAGHSFSVAISAHTGIGTLPILYFGTEEQKQKYLPKLISGEWAGAYGLTEPGSGSDALGAKTTATLTADGKHYLLNGQKVWITNGGFADVYTVFAKVDGDKFTAFIVERGFEGFSNGPEEDKMGIKGSSTVQLYFQDCKVPAENVLGEIGKGHNKRVQDGDPVTHAEIDCLSNAGRVGNYRDTVLYSTLMPCYLCAGAVVQFGIRKVYAGEDETFSGAKSFMESHGVEVINLESEECKQMMRTFIAEHPELWYEDIGEL